MKHKLYQLLACTVGAYHRSRLAAAKGDIGRREWQDKHEESIRKLTKAHMPSGSGFDSGTELDLSASTEEKLVFITSYHHMNEGGMYDGWTSHGVVITPSLASNFHMRITGKNRNDIKDLISDMFNEALTTEIGSDDE